MQTCMYVCMYVRMYVSMYVCMYKHTHTHAYVLPFRVRTVGWAYMQFTFVTGYFEF